MINLFEVFKAIDKRITLIFCENYKSVGYLSFTNYIDRNEIEIDQLFVLPKYQKNGYGVKLVKECENLAKKMGVKKRGVFCQSFAYIFSNSTKNQPHFARLVF